MFRLCKLESQSKSEDTKSFKKITKNTLTASDLVCLFKGGVVVLHACLTNRIRICSVPQSLDPNPHPGGCIIRTRHGPVKDLNRIDLPYYLSTPCHGGVASRK